MNRITEFKGISPDFWMRWGWVWSAIYIASLLICLTVTILVVDHTVAEIVWMIVLTILSVGWHCWWRFIYPGRYGDSKFRDTPIAMSLHMIGMAIFWYLSVQVSDIFIYALSGIYGLFFYMLPIGWAIIEMLIFSVVVVLTINQRTLGGVDFWNSDSLIFISFLVVGSLFGLWINGIINQSHQRRELLEELERTRGELAASERKAGQLAERQRLAQDIHDTLAQGFISIVMNLETAVPLIQNDKPKHHVDIATQTARDSLAQARYVVNDLRPRSLEKSNSLPEAIQRVAARWEREGETAVTVTITGDHIPLPDGTDVALLRATQEALANVRKHANAQTVQITLSYMGDVVILDVQDDGCGVAAKEERRETGKESRAVNLISGGYGLVAMEERLARLNGSVVLESERGEGTTLMVSIPIQGDVV